MISILSLHSSICLESNKRFKLDKLCLKSSQCLVLLQLKKYLKNTNKNTNTYNIYGTNYFPFAIPELKKMLSMVNMRNSSKTKNAFKA